MPSSPTFGRRAVITNVMDSGRIGELLSPREQMSVVSEINRLPKPPDPWNIAPWPRSYGRSAIVTGGDMVAHNPPETEKKKLADDQKPVFHGRRAILTGARMVEFNPGGDPLRWLGHGKGLDPQAEPLKKAPQDALDQLVRETPARRQQLSKDQQLNHRIGVQGRRNLITHELHPVVTMAVEASAADPNALDWIINRRTRGYNKRGNRKGSDLFCHMLGQMKSQPSRPVGEIFY